MVTKRSKQRNIDWTKEYVYTVTSRDAGPAGCVVEIRAMEPEYGEDGSVLPMDAPSYRQKSSISVFAVTLPWVRRGSQVAVEFGAHFTSLVANAMGEYPDYKPLTPRRLAPMLFGFYAGTGGFVHPHIDGPKD